MTQLNINSPAKINLALQIKSKRMDGYHNIKTIMQTINLFDKIKLTKSVNKEIKCYCSDANLPVNQQNLVVKAALEFFKTIKQPPKIKIEIIKNIPSQAGLGGASSNAASTLIGLNKLFHANLNQSSICNMAKKLGADVSFFIFKKTALVSGFGEIVTPLNSITPCYFVIVKPKNLNISTKKAFLLHDVYSKQFQNTKHHKISNIAQNINNNTKIKNYCDKLFNDFEKSLKIEEIKDITTKVNYTGALCALMSGSGSCVFGIFDNFKTAQTSQRTLKNEHQFQVFLCQPI